MSVSRFHGQNRIVLYSYGLPQVDLNRLRRCEPTYMLVQAFEGIVLYRLQVQLQFYLGSSEPLSTLSEQPIVQPC